MPSESDRPKFEVIDSLNNAVYNRKLESKATICCGLPSCKMEIFTEHTICRIYSLNHYETVFQVTKEQMTARFEAFHYFI